MLIAVEIYCPDTERCVLMVLWIVWWFCILLWDWHRGLVINFQRICHVAPRCLTLSSYTLPANYTQRQQNLLTPTASFKAEESHCLCYIVKPHHTHWVQRCGLLLPMFPVPCLYLLLDITVSCGKTDEPIELPFGIWTRAGPRNHVLGGGPDPQGKGAIFWSGAPLRCGLSPTFFDHLYECHCICIFELATSCGPTNKRIRICRSCLSVAYSY